MSPPSTSPACDLLAVRLLRTSHCETSTSEPPRDFSERDSHIRLPSPESDFHIPDDAERLALRTRRRTTKKG
ncbi:hypothetical protein N7536_001793 [Penicillium majusculum]|nr:hypothetical protein N7536_001793 [Penicillium majusculum]